MSGEAAEFILGHGSSRRTEKRFRVGDQKVRMVFERADGEESADTEVQLLDFAITGARLLVDSPARFQEAVTLRIENEEIGLRVAISASVCWIRKHDSERWCIGCSFEPALPDDSLEELFVHRVLNRRETPRLPIQGKAMAQWELREQPVKVEFVDLSEGGCCLQSPLAPVPNSRLILLVDRPNGTSCEITARTQWQVKRGEDFLIGCQFLSNRGYAKVCDALEIGIRKGLPAHRRKRSLKPLALLGIVAVIFLYCLLVLGR